MQISYAYSAGLSPMKAISLIYYYFLRLIRNLLVHVLNHYVGVLTFIKPLIKYSDECL